MQNEIVEHIKALENKDLDISQEELLALIEYLESQDEENGVILSIVYKYLTDNNIETKTHFVPEVFFDGKWERHRDYIRLTYQPDSDDFQLILFCEQFFISWKNIIEESGLFSGGKKNCTLTLSLMTPNPFLVIEKPIWAAHLIKESFVSELHKMLMFSLIYSAKLDYVIEDEIWEFLFPNGIREGIDILLSD